MTVASLLQHQVETELGTPLPVCYLSLYPKGHTKQQNLTGRTYSLLCQLSRTLILRVSQQFDNTTLIGRKTSDLLDYFSDEGGTLAEVALGTADARLGGDGSDFLFGSRMVSTDSNS